MSDCCFSRYLYILKKKIYIFSPRVCKCACFTKRSINHLEYTIAECLRCNRYLKYDLRIKNTKKCKFTFFNSKTWPYFTYYADCTKRQKIVNSQTIFLDKTTEKINRKFCWSYTESIFWNEHDLHVNFVEDIKKSTTFKETLWEMCWEQCDRNTRTWLKISWYLT